MIMIINSNEKSKRTNTHAVSSIFTKPDHNDYCACAGDKDEDKLS